MFYTNMARKFRNLDSTEEKNKAELLKQLRLKNTALNEAIAKFNSQVEEATAEFWVDVDASINQCNKVVEDVNEFVNNIKKEQQKYYDDREDRWKNSESGDLYQIWINSWDVDIEEIYLESPTFETVDDVEIDIEAFENLPHKVDS